MVVNTNGLQTRRNIKEATTPSSFSIPDVGLGSMSTFNQPTSFTGQNTKLPTITPNITKDIPVETPEVKQDMGKYFTNIPLEKETLLREKLKAKYPNETGEQRFERAKALVGRFTQEPQTKQTETIAPITELTPEATQSLKAGLARGEKVDGLKIFDDINIVGKLTEKIDDLIQKIPVLNTKEREAKLRDKIQSLPKEEIERLTDKFNQSQALKNMYGSVDNFIEESQMSLGDQFFGTGQKGIKVGTSLANTPVSLLTSATGILRNATNPAETLIGLKKLVGTKEGRDAIKSRYFTIEGFTKAMNEDLGGVASDVLAALEGGAGLAKGVAKGGAMVTAKSAPKLSTTLGKAADIAGDIGKTAGVASDLGVRSVMPFVDKQVGKLPNVLKVPAKIALAPTQPLKTIGDAAKSLPKLKKAKTSGVDSIDRLASNVYGLDAETVSSMRKNPELIKDIELGNLSKEGIKENLLNMVDDIEMQKGDIGKSYQALYEKGNTFNPKEILNNLQDNLVKNGVVMDNKGKITGFDITNKALANTPQGELNLIKNQYNLVVDSIKNKTDLNIEQLHNIKKTLGSARYTEGVMTKKSPLLGEISNVVNDKLKDVEGWADTDKLFSDKMGELRKISKLVETKQGEFKGTLKALLGERQYARLKELEKVYPGLTDKLETLKAYDDYLRTRETKKVGLYGNVAKSFAGGGIGAGLGYKVGGQAGAVVGGFVGSLLTNNLTDPKLLKDFLIRNVENGTEIVKKLEANKGLTPIEKIAVKNSLEPKQTTNANTINNIGDTTGINNKLDMRGSKTAKKSLQTKEVGDGGLKPKDTKGLDKVGTTGSAKIIEKQNKLVSKGITDKGTKIPQEFKGKATVGNTDAGIKKYLTNDGFKHRDMINSKGKIGDIYEKGGIQINHMYKDLKGGDISEISIKIISSNEGGTSYRNKESIFNDLELYTKLNKPLKPKQTKNITINAINGNNTGDTKLLGGEVKKNIKGQKGLDKVGATDFYKGKIGKEIKLNDGTTAKISQIDGQDVVIEITDKTGVDAYYIKNDEARIKSFIEKKNTITKDTPTLDDAIKINKQKADELKILQKAKYDDLDGFGKNKTPVELGKFKKTLNTNNRKEIIRDEIKQGYEPIVKKEETIVYNRNKYNKMDHKEQRIYEEKIKNSKKDVYYISKKTGENTNSSRKITKSEYEYAMQLKEIYNKANKGLKPKVSKVDKGLEVKTKTSRFLGSEKVDNLGSNIIAKQVVKKQPNITLELDAKKYNNINEFIETKLKEQTPAGTLKKYIGYDFDTINESVWKSRGNTLYIKFKKHNPGYLERLNKQNFIESALEAGGDNILQIKLKKGLIEKNTKTELKDIYNKANKGLKHKK